MVTHWPGVMSVGLAGVSSMIFVAEENATDADPWGPLTLIVVPDTESIDPTTSSSPLTFDGVVDGAGGDATAAVVFGAVGDSLGGLLLDEPQATTESAVIPTIASTEYQVIDAFCMVAPDRRSYE